MNKIFASARDAVKDIPDGATIFLSGFGLCGLPENLIQAVKEKGPKNLTLGSNNAGTSDFGITFLLEAGLVKKMISTYGASAWDWSARSARLCCSWARCRFYCCGSCRSPPWWL